MWAYSLQPILASKFFRVSPELQLYHPLVQPGTLSLNLSHEVEAQHTTQPPAKRKWKRQARGNTEGNSSTLIIARKQKMEEGISLASQGATPKKTKAVAEVGSQPRLPQ
jgi:hypothetical protein